MKDRIPHVVLAAAHFLPGPDAVPLGAASVASALKAAFRRRNRGPAIRVSLAECVVSEGAPVLVERILHDKPDFAGFSLYVWNRDLMVKAARILRSSLPGIFLFCGGPEAGALPAGLSLNQGGPFDAVLPGEGEDAAVRLFRKLLENNGKALLSLSPIEGGILQSHPPQLASLPSPWLDGTLKPRGREGVLWELGRGCPFGCIYCAESKGAGKETAGTKQVRYFSDDRIQQELRLFIREKIPYVFVLDPTFNLDAKRAKAVLDTIIREVETSGSRASNTRWHFEVRAELIDRGQAARFARLGASLQIGLQTADPRIAALIGRGFNRKRFEAGIGLVNEAGISFGLDLIYGLPGDSLDGYRKSLDYTLSLYPDNLDLFRLAVLPGTVLAERAGRWGLRRQDKAPYEVIETPDFSASDIEQAERISAALELFYNRGRAVAWFNQILRPLRLKPSAFLEKFARFLRRRSPGPQTEAYTTSLDTAPVIKLQLEFLEYCYVRARKERLIKAVRDIVSFHGAWGRALAEGLETETAFTYKPELVCGREGMDIERFEQAYKPDPGEYRMICREGRPELRRI
ncbi:MAG: DUF4080 domain-containing protein [Treponema sp.]|jgi:radical SAM superfamily enzyme YgiQ (UPF0313 family)|nr:DUF4080 domain-containing protein [Treponema sp.]